MTQPTGLKYFTNILSEEFSTKLKEFIESNEFKEDSFLVNAKNPESRLVAHYGYKYGYRNGNIQEKTKDFPKIIQELKELILQFFQNQGVSLPEDSAIWNQCIINRYLPGQGIGAHIDRPEYGDEIACVTVGGGAEMEFSRIGFDTYKLYTEDGSLYLMTGESRQLWKHQMRSRLSDPKHGERQTRYSFTFRTVI
jgi:alkylated DNA repair dioxygenase AlkB